jgi:uncharacterized protein YjlB
VIVHAHEVEDRLAKIDANNAYVHELKILSLSRNTSGGPSHYGWTGIWTDTVYDYTHFHSNAHEVLGIAKGRVTVKLGGDSGLLFRLKAGDMLILPAGVGHRRVGGSKELKVIGAYPPGQSHFDMKRTGRVMPKVPLPPTDPFFGADGPLVHLWAAPNNRAK